MKNHNYTAGPAIRTNLRKRRSCFTMYGWLNAQALGLLVLLVAVLAGCGAQGGERAGPAGERPNVLFITIDDLRPALGCYGDAVARTPHIDAVAAEGMVFRRAYCQAAVCAPSRTSFFTGLRPDSTKVYGFDRHFRETVPDVVTLPQHFKQHGYYTTWWGKVYHSGMNDPKSWTEPGAQLEPENWRAYVRAENLALDSLNRAQPGDPRFGPPYGKAAAPDSRYPDHWIADSTIATLRTLAETGQPFFLATGFIKPHLPFVAPARYWARYDREEIPMPAYMKPPQGAPDYALRIPGLITERYVGFETPEKVSREMTRTLRHAFYASVSFVDAQVGRVVEALKRLDLYENTIIVILGDHGQKLGEYGAWMKGTNFEVDTRAPLIVSVPGLREAARTTHALVEFVDLYPSLVDLAGLPVPDHLQGTSFVPLLNDPNRPWKYAAFSQIINAGRMGRSMRTDRYRFTRWTPAGRPDSTVAVELYDHKTDSLETRNVARNPAYEAVVERLMNHPFGEAWKAPPPQ